MFIFLFMVSLFLQSIEMLIHSFYVGKITKFRFRITEFSSLRKSVSFIFTPISLREKNDLTINLHLDI